MRDGVLPWVAPVRFGGPYQFSEETPLGFDQSALHHYLVKYLQQLLFAPDEPTGKADNPILKADRRWRLENRFSDAGKAIGPLLEITRTMVETQYKKISEFYDIWQDTARRQRILLLSLNITSLRAWMLWLMGIGGWRFG